MGLQRSEQANVKFKGPKVVVGIWGITVESLGGKRRWASGGDEENQRWDTVFRSVGFGGRPGRENGSGMALRPLQRPSKREEGPETREQGCGPGKPREPRLRPSD